ncbi:MAG: coenzyme F420-0:L-glutamate ligase, partial [Limnochordia bacterium]
MKTLPSYIGPAAFGIKMGVFLPGSDLVGEIVKRARDCAQDGLLADGDVLCITESVVARVQGNIVSVEYVAQEIREKLGLSVESTVGVLFPITSRNRFALILESIALAVPEGKVIVQLNYPADEVGNQTIGLDFLASLDLKEDYIPQEMLNGYTFVHPITKVDYVQYYKEVIAKTGATPEIIFSNNPQHIARYSVDGVIVADIHRRHRTLGALKEVFSNCITLQDICNSGLMRSDWGLLGSNMSSDGMLKLAPRDGQQVVDEIQRAVYEETGK